MSTGQTNITSNIAQSRFAKLARLGEQVFHTNDLASLWGISNKNTLYTTLKRYTKAGLIFRIYKGLYSIGPVDKIDPYLLGIKALHKFAYISTETALFNAGIILQDIKYITIISSKSKKFFIGDINYRSRQLNDKFLFQDYGINTKCGVNIATVERAVADILYFNPNFYFDNPKQIDWKEVKKIQKEVYDITK
jgi:predicted transcriptional regulator of viral defense system